MPIFSFFFYWFTNKFMAKVTQYIKNVFFFSRTPLRTPPGVRNGVRNGITYGVRNEWKGGVRNQRGGVRNKLKFLKVEYVMEYVMIVESQNSWSMEEIHRNFLMASNVSFGFIWVHFLSYFHFVHLLTTSTTSQNKPHFDFQIDISGKAFFEL